MVMIFLHRHTWSDVGQSPGPVVGDVREPPVAQHVETAGVPQTDGSVLGEVQPARHQGPVHLHQELLVTVNQNLQCNVCTNRKREKKEKGKLRI